MLANSVLASIKAIIPGAKLTSFSEEIHQFFSRHIGGGAGMKTGIHAEFRFDTGHQGGGGKRLPRRQHHMQYFVSMNR